MENGTATYFDNAINSSANAVFVSKNGDIYVAGYNDSRACYWKNGSIIYFGELGYSSTAYSISVSEADVYISGYFFENPISALNQKPVYWKNNVKISLPTAGGISAFIAPAITTSATDTHIIGYGIFPGFPGNVTKGLYWKNGVLKLTLQMILPDHTHQTLLLLTEPTYI